MPQSENAGLVLSRIKTQTVVEEINDLTSMKQIIEKITACFKVPSHFVAFLEDAVSIGKWDEKQKILQCANTGGGIKADKVLELRVFSTEKELYFWREVFGSLCVRLREDTCGEESYVVDARQVIWGTRATAIDVGQDWTELTEELRGIRLVVPFAKVNVDDGRKRVKLKTRHYIGYNAIGQAGYVDARFVGFESPDGGEMKCNKG